VLNAIAGVRESAVVGMKSDGGERVHAALALDDGVEAEEVLRQANARLEDHQKICGYTVWPATDLPRTEGTRKLKRRAIRQQIAGETPAATPAHAEGVEGLLAKWSAGRTLDAGTSLDDLGLSSLDRVELLVALEQRLGAPVDESAFAAVRTVADLEQITKAPPVAAPDREVIEFPTWNRAKWADWFRVFNQHLWLLNLARIFAWVRVDGRENLKAIEGPVIFASNHQGYFDTPIVLLALPFRWRRRVAPAMRKEFFDAHFNPRKYNPFKWFTNSLNYWLSALMFNALPIPQREAGTRQTLRYIGELVEEGWCPLIFPEGKHSRDETVLPFQAGAAMMAARLGVPVVPVRIRGSNRVLHPDWRMARPAFVNVRIGEPVRLEGEDYAALARILEQKVREL
jgi:long-chain acyl-CoA synthetase